MAYFFNYFVNYSDIDGYNGTWAVDLVDQSILTNTYFDHLDTLQSEYFF